MKNNKTNKFETHYNYITSVRDQLIQAEQTVEKIKNSKEWKTAFQYFQTLYNRGQLKERPTKANGYRIEYGKNTLKLSDIEDILTPEQMAEIKKRIH